jgi:hypothetical protein
MSRRDARLRAIRAEIHKCRDELVFLGCVDLTLKQSRDDALRRTIAQLDQMKPKINSIALLEFVDGVRPLLEQLTNASFDDSKEGSTLLQTTYTKLKFSLTTLVKAISNAEFTRAIEQVETTIERTTRVHNTNHDHYLQAVLHMIGAHMTLIYYEFMNESWLKPVAMGIPTISHILQDAY